MLINKELLRIFSVLLSLCFYTHTLILSAKQLISERLWWFDNRRLLCSEMTREEREREGKFDQKYGFWCRTHLRYSETDLNPAVICVCVSYLAGCWAALVSVDQWTTRYFITYTIYIGCYGLAAGNQKVTGSFLQGLSHKQSFLCPCSRYLTSSHFWCDCRWSKCTGNIFSYRNFYEHRLWLSIEKSIVQLIQIKH